MKHVPVIGFSELTGRVYIITSFNRDGSARTKFDVTEKFLEAVQSAIASERERAVREMQALKRFSRPSNLPGAVDCPLADAHNDAIDRCIQIVKGKA